MPFSNIPKDKFRGREEELGFLKSLSGGSSIAGSILLTGQRGIGKTALLRHLHRTLFKNLEGPVPFYYRFQSPSLKGSAFAKDIFARLVRQTVACYKHDESLAANLTIPLQKIMNKATGQKLAFLHELAEDFDASAREGDFHSMINAALSAPAVVAEKLGLRVVVMLDDFHLSNGLYENNPGDTPFASNIFTELMDAAGCSYILACHSEEGISPGLASRLALHGLAEDSAFALFKDDCSMYGIDVPGEARELMKYTCGNPSYIKNIANAIHVMKRDSATPENFRECYAHDVAEGDTATYLASVLGGQMGSRLMIRPALELMMHLVETQDISNDPKRLFSALGIAEEKVETILDGLVLAGFVRAGAAISIAEDTVLQDSIRARYMIEVEGRASEIVREDMILRRFGPEGEAPMRFEVVIPSDVPEAELVAAKAVRQMAENAKMGSDEADRLQLAVIEACINAMEHSGSHEKKVFLTCTVKDGRIEVCVESQGGKSFELGGPAEKPEDAEDGGTPRMRGYGLKLISGYTDGLKVERAGSRARLVLLKNIKSVKENHD